MRWDGLFADLESEWAAQRAAQVMADAAELTRGEWASLTLAQRLRGAIGEDVRVTVRGAAPVSLRLQSVSADWIGGATAGGSVIVPCRHLSMVEAPLSAAVVDESRGRSLASVLRSLARMRAAVVLVGVDGAEIGQGTVDRVGADHLDLARHARDEPRRAAAVRARATVPFDAIALVRSSAALR